MDNLKIYAKNQHDLRKMLIVTQELLFRELVPNDLILITNSNNSFKSLTTYLLAEHLTTLLQPYIYGKPSYIRDSAHFVGDILVSFDIVSLFTKVPLVDTLRYIADLFPSDITNLFKQCLRTSYFVWDGSFYKQTDGVAMGSLLSPVVANLFMEQFESLAIETAVDKPTVWWRYVDDTFVVWPHGRDKLERFLEHLNGVHPNI
ncbi:hypothetical protein Trydic_g4603 [Trypoxylus dichotomus]